MRIASAPRGRIIVAVLPILLAVRCSTSTPVLTGLLDAHDAAGNLQVHFAKAVDASNRAVMADTDEVSSAAAQEAERATEAAQRDVARLGPMLKDLQFADELRALESFDTRFSEYPANRARHPAARSREHEPEGTASAVRRFRGCGDRRYAGGWPPWPGRSVR